MLRYKDVVKRDLIDYGIDSMRWQTVAEERPTWRTSLTGGSAIDIKTYQTDQEIKCARRHARNLPSNKQCFTRQKLATATTFWMCYIM